MQGYASHVWHDVAAEKGESLRRECSCGALRRVRVAADLRHVVETSTDGGKTWTENEYGAACPRRLT